MAYHAYATTVLRRTQLSTSFVRVTFTGDELDHFGTAGLDQRIKVMLPLADGSFSEIGMFGDSPTMMDWYATWRALPDEKRNVLRTYTIRAIRPAQAEIDIDFVVHGDTGPASSWVLRARPGDRAIIVGPDARDDDAGTSGIEWRPRGARRVLLAGDETATPAIIGILETLDPSYSGHAFLEVPTADDVLAVHTEANVTVEWLPRGDRPHGDALRAAVEDWAGSRAAAAVAHATTAPALAVDEDDLWDVPAETSSASTFYAWLAGESGLITGLRRRLVSDHGFDKKQIAFMGYWRQGRAES